MVKFKNSTKKRVAAKNNGWMDDFAMHRTDEYIQPKPKKLSRKAKQQLERLF